MVHIILLILKILGIILLVTAGLILIICLGVLLLPFQYDLSGSYYKHVLFNGKLNWIFGIFNIYVSYAEKQFEMKLNVFKHSLFHIKKSFGGDRSETEKEADIEEAFSFSDEENELYEEMKLEELEVRPAPKVETESKSKPLPEILEPVKEEKKSSGFRSDEKKQKPRPKANKIQKLLDSIKNKMHSIQKTFQKIVHKKELAEKLWNLDCTQHSIHFVKKGLRSLLKHFMPKKLVGSIHFGFEDPAVTGKALGLASTFYCVSQDHLYLQPDFEQSIIEGEGQIKGNFQLYILAYWAVKGFFNKDIRKLVKYIKHIKSREETLWQ